jgi:starch phosphorylase
VNVSILDGWWAEGFDGENGFGIEPVLDAPHEERNAREAALLYEMLEQRVLPEYYAGAAGTPPAPAWLRRVRRSVATALVRFSSVRILEEYRSRFYTPAAHLAGQVRGSRGKVAVNLARWRKLVQSRWPGVRLELQSGDSVRAAVVTNGIPAESFAVEAEGPDGARRRLSLVAGDHERAEFAFESGHADGVRAYRAFPQHELLAHPYELGLMVRVEPDSST